MKKLTEITRADGVVDSPEEMQVNVDPFDTGSTTFILGSGNAIGYENHDISGGLVTVGDIEKTLRVKGQF